MQYPIGRQVQSSLSLVSRSRGGPQLDWPGLALDKSEKRNIRRAW